LKAIILGAGSGSRLGKQVPKPLVNVSKGCTILDVQLEFLTQILSIEDILLVVGFRSGLIEKRYPQLRCVHNDQYATTNTAASLLIGLQETGREDVLWLNGDIVFDAEVLSLLERYIAHNLVWVNMNRVGDEEVKYTLDRHKCINEISKSVTNALGEAVGINLITYEDFPVLRSCLERCCASDYFERALQFAIERGVKFVPVNIERRFCVEVDYQEDLERVQSFVQKRWRR
jgi:choline kinase